MPWPILALQADATHDALLAISSTLEFCCPTLPPPPLTLNLCTVCHSQTSVALQVDPGSLTPFEPALHNNKHSPGPNLIRSDYIPANHGRQFRQGYDLAWTIMSSCPFKVQCCLDQRSMKEVASIVLTTSPLAFAIITRRFVNRRNC
jgi:hypothetical protein